MQLEVLDLAISEIEGPVFDLGCGSEARLGRYLQHRGIEAFGIDRELYESDDNHLYAMTWFDFPLGELSAELIISHLAFSSHLLYQHTSGGLKLSAYVDHNYRILDALRVGGEFRYAPALPFLEMGLPKDRFAVNRWAVAEGFHAAGVTRVAL